jgi:hypothetical protein
MSYVTFEHPVVEPEIVVREQRSGTQVRPKFHIFRKECI